MFDKHEALGLRGNPVSYTPGVIYFGYEGGGAGAKACSSKMLPFTAKTVIVAAIARIYDCVKN